jgi:hypothetical protein
MKIKTTTNSGIINYPEDLQGLEYIDAIHQLNLLEQGNEEYDRQSEDVLCVTDAHGDWILYEIED